MARLLKTKLRAWQVRAVRLGLRLERIAIYAQQRTGKTLMILFLVARLWQKGLVRRVLIICPKSAIGVWERQMRLHYAISYQLGFPLIKNDTLAFSIINFERAHMLMPGQDDYDCVVVDEIHRIKSHNSRQSIACWELGRGIRFKFGLTGTPIDEGEVDLWAQFRFLRDELLGSDWWSFRKRWMRGGGYHHLKRKLKKHLIKSFLALLSPFIFQITRKEVLDLPPEEDYVIPFKLTGNAARVYREMENELSVKIGGKEVFAPLAVTNMAKLAQVTGGFLNTEDETFHLEQDKLQTLIDYLEDWPLKTKIVIFCKFTDEIDAIKKVLSRKRTVAVLDGRTKDESIWERFQDENDPSVIVVQIDKGGVAIELSVAELGIFYSKGFSYIAYDQARARLIGQNKAVLFAHLIAEHSIDEDQMGVVERKGWNAMSILKQLKHRRGQYVHENHEDRQEIEPARARQAGLRDRLRGEARRARDRDGARQAALAEDQEVGSPVRLRQQGGRRQGGQASHRLIRRRRPV